MRNPPLFINGLTKYGGFYDMVITRPVLAFSP